MRRFWMVWGVVWATMNVAAAPRPLRLVSLLPSHTEILQALGAEAALVAVSDGESSTVLPSLPRAGGLPPRWELLMALRPDLVLADSAHERFQADFARFHIPVHFYPATHVKTIEEVLSLIQTVGRDIGCAAEAEKLRAQLSARLAALDVRSLTSARPRVYFEIWPRPLQAVGPVSLQGHLLSRAGFDNIVPDTRSEMPLISAEWVVQQNPDFIFYTSVSPREEIRNRPGWGRLRGLQDQHLVLLEGDLFSRAGPRVVEALEVLLKLKEQARP